MITETLYCPMSGDRPQPQWTFQECLDHASLLVSGWPAWKQNILENSAKPTVAVPRTPIVSDEEW